MRELFSLYYSFFLIGSLTFGGGYAMLPMLNREIVDKHGWATEDELLDYFAIGQCTPGVIAVNTATFIGYKRRGFFGSLFSTLGVITPSIVIIVAIAALLSNFMELAWIQHAFSGIRIAVCALIASTVIKLCKTTLNSVIKALFAIAAFALVGLLKISPVYVTLGFAIIGGLLFTRRTAK